MPMTNKDFELVATAVAKSASDISELDTTFKYEDVLNPYTPSVVKSIREILLARRAGLIKLLATLE